MMNLYGIKNDAIRKPNYETWWPVGLPPFAYIENKEAQPAGCVLQVLR